MTKDGLLAMLKSSALKSYADTATGLRKAMKRRYTGLQNPPGRVRKTPKIYLKN